MDLERNVNWRIKGKRERNESTLYLPEPRDSAHQGETLLKKEFLSRSNRTLETQKHTNKIDESLEMDKNTLQISLSNMENCLQNKLGTPEESRKKLCLSPRKHLLLNPAEIIGFLHVFLNLFVISAILFCLVYILYFISSDVRYGISKNKEALRVKIEEAKHLYNLNKCNPLTRVPAMELQCGEWDHLIRTGFYGIKYSKIMMELVADAANSFFGTLKLRSIFSIAFCGVMLVVCKKVVKRL